MSLLEIFLFANTVLLAYAGVEVLRRWSVRRGRFDVPNERSSHTAPTPRGGGLIIVILSLAAYSICALRAEDGTFVWAYAVGALSIALISWLDDLYTISFVWRFSVHFSAALLVVLTIGGFGEIYLPGVQTELTWEIGGFVLTLLWIVWLTNAYNFMDGIDGIAGMQAVTAGIGWLFVGKLLGADSFGLLGGAVAFASLGFLIQNWQPAKIFMGDVGSAFLGYTFAVLPLLVNREIKQAEITGLLPLAAVAFNWLFVFDTIYTFFRRLLNRERVWEAHRSHLYQRLIIEGFSHRSVTIFYGVWASLTTLAAILWLNNSAGLFWEWILLLTLVAQSIGLLICVRRAEQKRRL